jgi:hypothetical protein
MIFQKKKNEEIPQKPQIEKPRYNVTLVLWNGEIKETTIQNDSDVYHPTRNQMVADILRNGIFFHDEQRIVRVNEIRWDDEENKTEVIN